MFVKAMRPIIIKAMTYNIYNLSTYKGYDGAGILRIDFKDIEEMITLRDYTRTLGHTTNVLKERNIIILYCIFEAPDDIYALKD